MSEFNPKPPLVDGHAGPACRAVVVIPARNEEDSVAATLDCLRRQKDADGRPLPLDLFETVLLLNNCTDDSVGVARRWCAAHPSMTVHVCERSLVGDDAHVGMARSLLMDTAWQRLGGGARGVCGILTTDADTEPAPDWIVCNLHALEAGADVVGGCITLDAALLPPQARLAYEQDREYQRLVAEFEGRLDPQECDPCPRHLEHFGGSLACTPAIYARAGGMPAVTPLEDVAFIDRLRRIDARIRHEPKVKVFTSARLAGRVDVGLSGQLRQWQQMAEQGTVQSVASAEYLQHRFTLLGQLRRAYAGDASAGAGAFGERLSRVAKEHGGSPTCGEFLAMIDCDRHIDESFRGVRETSVAEAITSLATVLKELSARPL